MIERCKNMDNEKLLEFIRKNRVHPLRYFYLDEDDKVQVSYTLMNTSYDAEIIAYKAKNELNIDYKTLAESAYNLLDIKHSQEQEFYID